MSQLLDMLEDLNDETRKTILKAPFGWPGGKYRSLKHLLKILPYADRYIEPFGGSGIVLLNRQPSQFEVLNDRYAGVIDFYRCLRNRELYMALTARLEAVQYAREEFVIAKETWHTTTDPVERAALWYTMISLSFADLCRCFGRMIHGRSIHAFAAKLKDFPEIHHRLRNVLIENLDWEECLTTFDKSNTVIYIDPPYLDASAGTYKVPFTIEDHRRLLDRVFASKSYIAVSGYANNLYDSRPWDERHTWNVATSINSVGDVKGNKKDHIANVQTRVHTEEVLWVKHGE
jgi:DNA adenine methylase